MIVVATALLMGGLSAAGTLLGGDSPLADTAPDRPDILATGSALGFPPEGVPEGRQTGAPTAPAAFVRNDGQVADPAISYYARQGGVLVGFGNGFVRYVVEPAPSATPLGEAEPPVEGGAALTLSFDGGRTAPPLPRDPVGGARHFFLGSDPSAWQRGVPSYGALEYRDVWPGVDVVYRATANGPKYDVVAHPGADLSAVAFTYGGVERLVVDEEGALIATTSGSALKDSPPTAASEGRPIGCAFALRSSATFGFDCPAWSGASTLVIDPLMYSSFLGGASTDYGRGLRVHSDGSVYVAGYTQSTNFPSTNGALQTSSGGGYDFFVTRFDSSGALLWSTYLGGSSTDQAVDLWVDAAGAAYVVGFVISSNFPTTAGAYSSTLSGGYDVGVAKIDASGSNLLFSTYLGGSSNDYGYGISVGANNTVYVGGYEQSTNFPVDAGAFQTTRASTYEGFIARFNQTGALLNSTYVGGNNIDYGYALRTDGNGLPVLVGGTSSTNFPVTTNAAQKTNYGGYDVFVTQLNADLTGAIYSTYLGGSSTEYGYALAVRAGLAYVTGGTASSNYPTAGTAFSGYSSGYDAFLSVVNLGSGSLTYGSFFGGTSTEYGYGVSVNSLGEAVVAGYTASTNFPVTTYRDQQNLAGSYDTFVLRLNAAGSQLIYGTLLGGSSTDYAYALALDANGSAYITGYTASSNYPVTPGAYDTTYASADAFLTKVDMRKPRLTMYTDPPGLNLFNQNDNVTAPFVDECTSLRRIDAASPQYFGTTRYVFDHWSNGGSKLQTVDCGLGDVTVTAYFRTEFQVNLSTNPAGLPLTVDDIQRSTPVSFWWENGSNHHVDAMPLYQSNGTRFVFAQWSVGGTGRFDYAVNGTLQVVAEYTISQYLFEARTDRTGTYITLDGNRYESPISEWLDAGSTHTLSAPDIVMGGADIRNTFSRWSDDGPISRTFDVNSRLSLVAQFTTEYFTLIQTDPEGISIEFDGVETLTPISGWWAEGESHHLKGPFDEVELGDALYRLTGWADSYAAERTVYADGPVTYTALFTPSSYRAAFLTVPAGLLVEVDRERYTAPVDLWWEVGTDHVVQAVSPQEGVGARYVFSGWSDHLQVTHVVTAVGPAELTARFSTEYEVVVETAPTGLAISVDGVEGVSPTTVWWLAGARHDIGVEDSQALGTTQRWSFDSWSDGGARIHAASASGPTVFTATFAPSYKLTIESSHAAPACDVLDCWYRGGTSATFHVDELQVASNGVRFAFNSWTGDYSSADPQAVVLMDGPKRVVAVWDLQYELVVSSAHGNATGAGWYNEGERATVSVSADKVTEDGVDFVFVGWTGGAASPSKEASVTMDGPKTVTAVWNRVGDAPPDNTGGDGGQVPAAGSGDLVLFGGLGAAVAAAALVGLLLMRRRKSPDDVEEHLAAPAMGTPAAVHAPVQAAPPAAPAPAVFAPARPAQPAPVRQTPAAPPKMAPTAPPKPAAVVPPSRAAPAAAPKPSAPAATRPVRRQTVAPAPPAPVVEPAPRSVEAPPAKEEPPAKPPAAPVDLKCHSCGEPIEANWSVCPFCEAFLLR